MSAYKDLLGDTLFDGATIVPARDFKRLSGQLQAVKSILKDHQWHTLAELAMRVGGSEAGVSARIRDMRKPNHGAHKIERRHVNNGLHEYRLWGLWDKPT